MMMAGGAVSQRKGREVGKILAIKDLAILHDMVDFSTTIFEGQMINGCECIRFKKVKMYRVPSVSPALVLSTSLMAEGQLQ